jgi:hypothetical protein
MARLQILFRHGNRPHLGQAGMLSKNVLNERDAKKYANDWVSNCNRSAEIRHGQFDWLMTELAALCVAESVRVGEEDIDLDGRLNSAYEIISSLQSYGFPADLMDSRWADSSTLSDPIKKRLAHAKASVWKRRDPMLSFKEGFESAYHFGGSPSEIHSVLGDYLKFRWLRHPSVDWIFLDLMITRELSALGEQIKKHYFPGKKDSMGVHHKYWKARGKLANMAPSGLAILFGPSKEFSDPNSPYMKVLKVWDSMYNTWRALSGPVINPTVVRDEMLKSKGDGAVWDVPSWALIDRVIEFDRSVWLVGPYA